MRQPSVVDEAVLEAVRAIPPGMVATYGDVADVVGEFGLACGPRRVARALADFGATAPWWRVVLSGGRLAPPVADEQRRRLAAEGLDVAGGLLRRRWEPSAAEVSGLERRFREGGDG